MGRRTARGRGREVERLQSLLSRSGDWFAVVDDGLTVRWSAGNAVGVTGRGSDDLVGLSLAHVLEVEGHDIGDVLRRSVRGEDRRSGFRAGTLHEGGARSASFSVVDGRSDDQIGGYLLIGRDDTAIQVARRQLRDLAHVDELTGIGSRIEAERELAVRLAAMGRGESAPLLLLVDVVDFRGINQVHGAVAGDLLLRELAAVLTRWAHDEGHVARVGADQFLVQVEPPAAGTAADLAGSLLRAVDRTHQLGREVLRPRVRVVHLRPTVDQRDPGQVLVALDAMLDRGAPSTSVLVDLDRDDQQRSS